MIAQLKIIIDSVHQLFIAFRIIEFKEFMHFIYIKLKFKQFGLLVGCLAIRILKCYH
jgi:hypothetical protein